MADNVNIDVVAENLTELLTNTVNMTGVYYDLFFNPTPMDVTLYQYDNKNRLVKVVIPNRAKDRRIALSGQGSPEGKVSATIGTAYIDTSNRAAYMKVTADGNTGWMVVLTQSSVEEYLRNYLDVNKYMTEPKMVQYLNDHDYIDRTKLNTALEEFYPTIKMNQLQSTGTLQLRDNTGFMCTPTGNVKFVLPKITDSTKLHKIFVQLQVNSSSYNIDLGTDYYFDGVQPDLSERGSYNIVYEYDNNGKFWAVGFMFKGTSEIVFMNTL